MTKERSTYQSYLLRLWDTEAGWRASLEYPHTGERRGFASLEQLFAFLKEQTEAHAQAGRESKDINDK